MQATPKQAKATVVQALKAGLVPMLTGSPGTGKSALMQEVADEFNLVVIDVRLAQVDPTELCGFPMITDDRMDYAPPRQFPLQELDTIPKKKNGWLLVLDEITSAPMATQAAAYKLVLDRQVGKYHLHKKVAIVCAGNRTTDNAVVNRLSTAMQSRLIHIDMVTSVDDWLEWAAQNQIDPRITAYIQFRPDILHNFDPDHNDQTFSCPRTWQFAHKLINKSTDLRDFYHALSGTLSEGVAREFITYSGLMSQLPTFQEILDNPDAIKIDSEPGMLYAVSHMLSARMDIANIDPVMKYMRRLPIEFMTIAVKAAQKRNPKILDLPQVQSWMNELADEIFA